MLLVAALVARVVSAHGTMVFPPQRGCTNGYEFAKIPIYDSSASVDWWAHFPAGDKSSRIGSAFNSQKREAGWRGWTPYNPRDKNFVFRAGPCGDLKRKPEHMRGGKYYNGGKVFASYEQGGYISIDLAITAHHNGYTEFRMCDVKRCGGEISNECLRGPHCHLLQRAWDGSCESRRDRWCAPIDPLYPSRWYLPCGKPKGTDIYGKGKIKYKLPVGLVCEHCVLQWYWVSANGCNPPGVVRFFKSNRGPQWGQCKGQGGAIGGWRRWEALCGGKDFAEEYYQCADVRIRSKGGVASRPAPPRKPAPQPPRSPARPPAFDWPFNGIAFFADGRVRQVLYKNQDVSIDVRRFRQFTFVARTVRIVPKVGFYINNKLWRTESKAPYSFTGGAGNRHNAWKNPWINTRFKMEVRSGSYRMAVHITLRR